MKKHLLAGLCCLAAGTVPEAPAAQLTIAVTQAMAPEAIADLAAAAERLAAVLPTRLVVRGIPLADDWAKRPYWKAAPEAQAALRSELQTAWSAFARDLPAAGLEIDPAFFRRHRIATAPVFVLEADPVIPAGKTSCEAAPQEGDAVIVRGNVTAGHAIDVMVREAESLSPGLRALAVKLQEAGLW